MDSPSPSHGQDSESGCIRIRQLNMNNLPVESLPVTDSEVQAGPGAKGRGPGPGGGGGPGPGPLPLNIK